MAKKIFKNYVPDEKGIRYKMTPNTDGTVSLDDVTNYSAIGDAADAAALNSFVQEDDAIPDAEIDAILAL